MERVCGGGGGAGGAGRGRSTMVVWCRTTGRSESSAVSGRKRDRGEAMWARVAGMRFAWRVPR
jgi:hypothetical protein